MTIGVASLTVPDGALAEPTELEMRSREGLGGLAPAPEGAQTRSNTLTLLPHGLEFSKEVSVRLDHDEPAMGVGSLVVGKLTDDDDDTWEVVPGASFRDGVAQFSVDGFSHYVVFEAEGGELGGTGGMATDATGGTGGIATGGTSGEGGTGGIATGGTGGTGGIATGGAGTGGAPTSLLIDFPEPLTEVTLGSYDSGPFSGFARGFASGGAQLVAGTGGDSLPHCIRANLPPSSGTVSLEFTLNELSEGNEAPYTLAKMGFRFEVSMPNYSGQFLQTVYDSELLAYDQVVPPNAGPYGPSYEDFVYMGEQSLSALDSVIAVEFTIFADPEVALIDQEICVDSLDEL